MTMSLFEVTFVDSYNDTLRRVELRSWMSAVRHVWFDDNHARRAYRMLLSPYDGLLLFSSVRLEACR